MVHFVGAGPGAPDLITVRGKALLERADTIIYAGSLVNKELLGYAKQGCAIYNSAEMTLDEVIDVTQKAEAKGHSIVRLHTGDPSIYGAIREQMGRLDELGIAYEVCPGVSSFLAAAAMLNCEYTLPGVTQSVVITRMAGRTDVPDAESIAGFAAHGCTMIIFLSASMIPGLARELMEGGYAADTPAAIVYKASWPEEQAFRCRLDSLAETAAQNNINKTALIIVGNCLGDDYQLSKLYDPSFSTEYRQAKA